MMTAARKTGNHRIQAGAGAHPPLADPHKRTISATERWQLISRNAYSRAQRRGFVGGDLFEDLWQAIQQIDEEYVTDVKGMLSMTDAAEMAEQFRDLFAGYGLGKRSLDGLLEINHEALEKLAASNRALLNGAGERTARRASLLRDVTDEAMRTLQSMVRSARQMEDLVHLPGEPLQALLDIVSRLSALTNSAQELAEASMRAGEDPASRSQRGLEVHGAVNKAYEGMTPAELAEAPVGALKGVSPAHSEELESAFGMVSIRDMANSYLVEQAEGIVTLAAEEMPEPRGGLPADSGDSLRKLADGPVDKLKGITPRQAAVLRDTFRIRTIRELAKNRFFRVASAIVTLASLES